MVGAYRGFLYIMPVLIGWAAYAGISRADHNLRLLELLLKFTAVFLVFGAAWTIFVSGAHTPWEFIRAGGAVTAVVIATYFFTQKRIGNSRFIWYGIALLCPLIGQNRMAFLVCLMIPVLVTFAKKPTVSRTAFGILCGISALAVLLSIPSLEQKMFYTGQGSILTFVQDPGDIRTHGRAVYWALLISEMSGLDWLIGHGANVSSIVIAEFIADQNHPHNDWLRLLFDFGAIGVVAYAWAIFREFQKLSLDNEHTLALFGRVCLIALSVLMLTGNVALYGIFFGNLVYFVIGVRRKKLENRIASEGSLHSKTRYATA